LATALADELERAVDRKLLARYIDVQVLDDERRRRNAANDILVFDGITPCHQSFAFCLTPEHGRRSTLHAGHLARGAR
jgi:hypothetical protein